MTKYLVCSPLYYCHKVSKCKVEIWLTVLLRSLSSICHISRKCLLMCITVSLYSTDFVGIYCLNTLQNPSRIFQIISFSGSSKAATLPQLNTDSRKKVVHLANILATNGAPVPELSSKSALIVIRPVKVSLLRAFNLRLPLIINKKLNWY